MPSPPWPWKAKPNSQQTHPNTDTRYVSQAPVMAPGDWSHYLWLCKCGCRVTGYLTRDEAQAEFESHQDRFTDLWTLSEPAYKRKA